MLDGLSLVSIRECSMDASDPIPSSCAPDIRFSEFRFVEADICFVGQNFRTAYFWRTGRGNGVTGVHRAFSDRYQGESIERSLMDP